MFLMSFKKNLLFVLFQNYRRFELISTEYLIKYNEKKICFVCVYIAIDNEMQYYEEKQKNIQINKHFSL